MSIRPLKGALPDEHIHQVEPSPQPFVDAGWRGRPHFHTDRALSAEALSAEQRQRSGQLALRGQRVAPGVVTGLEARLESQYDADLERHIHYFQLAPGMGLTASGEDVVLPRSLRVRVDSVPVYRPGENPAGLQLGVLAHVDAATTQIDLKAAVLVLVPVVTRRDDPPDPNDPAELDLERRALDDHRLVDGCALVLFAWPSSWPMPEQDARFRNHLAWELFERERLRPHDEPAPWEEVGVALALVGFHAPACAEGPSTPLFADRAAVVRPGGAPRTRTPLLPAHGTPLLWQARIQQFSEHLASIATEQTEGGEVLAAFELLPPVGMLPRNTLNMDFGHIGHWRRFFPPSFAMTVVPVPLEQLDAVALASASLAPLRLPPAGEEEAPEEKVRVLVPVPEVHFEPELLRNEEVSAEFQDAIDTALDRLNQNLWQRAVLRSRATALRNAIEGKKDESVRFPAGEPSVEGERPPPVPNPYEPQEDPNDPLKEFHGTRRDATGVIVPRLEKALFQNGTWAEPDALPGDRYGVSSALSPARTLAVLSRGPLSTTTTTLTVRLQPEQGPQTTEPLTYDARGPLDAKVLWSGEQPVIALLAHGGGNTAAHVNLLQKGDSGWTEAGKLDLPQGATIKHFTAVSWRPGCIDAFVATAAGIRKFTWIQGVPQPNAIQHLGENRQVLQVVALSVTQGQVHLLFLGSEVTAPAGGPAWLHHISARHEDEDPRLVPAGAGTELEPLEVRNLKGSKLDACVTTRPTLSTSERLDALVMGSGGIRHGWFDGRWKLGLEMVSVTSGEALLAVSEGDEQVHAFWWGRTFGGDGPLMYRRFDGAVGRWVPAEQLSFPALHLAPDKSILDQPFSVVFLGSNPNIFLARPSGLVRMKKVAKSTRETVDKKGLKGLIENIEGLYQETVRFIGENSSRVQSELQHMRRLMVTSSTEASRLAVSASLGSTLVASPLVVRADVEGYLTSFHTRTLRRLEPIRLSDAMEALDQATTTRLEVSTRLMDLVKRILDVKELGLDVANLFLVGIARTESIPGGSRVQISGRSVLRESPSLRELVDKPSRLAEVLRSLDDEPENLRRALTARRLRWTESQYFSTALLHLENTLNLLRVLERRLAIRVNVMEGYKRPLKEIQGFSSDVDKVLRIVDGEIAEARQDVTVARALLEEETARVKAINLRREQVIARHVPFLIYQRPRQDELTREAPARLLDPGFAPDILPEVLASTAAAPPELLAFVELVRDSPLKWFALAPQLLGGLDRLEFVRRTFIRAQARAIQRLPIRYPTVSSRAVSPYIQSLSRLLSAREDLVARRRGAFVHFQPAILETRTWLELQQSAREQLSLGDLIDNAHGRADVARDAATLLEHLAKVATGLYQRFSEALPAIRLEWAEQMSQYDEPVNLRDLSRLPRWDEVEVMERREMQLLVDWLFQRVVSTESEAVSLINDLVRVCMLLASHAPVNELLSGNVTRPTEARVGGSIELAVDPERVRVGMHVVIRSGTQAVQAVVEDVSSTAVRARVLSTSAPTVNLPERAAARFADPVRGGHALLPLLGEAW